MRAQVILLKRTPLRIPFFDYEVPEELSHIVRVGQLVRVPFRAKEEFGIIKSIDHGTYSGTAAVKKISSVTIQEPLISESQLAFLVEMSDTYHTSLGFLVKSNLLPLQKRKLAKLNRQPWTAHNPTTIEKPNVASYANDEHKRAHIVSAVYGGQTLIVVPETKDAAGIAHLLHPHASKEIFVADKELSIKQFFNLWVNIWKSPNAIIIGTRSALFLPFFNLTSIIIDNEANPNHKSWDMAPRFHAKDAALILSRHHKARLHFTQHTPSFETYFFAKKNILHSAQDSNLVPALFGDTILCDMRDERKAGNALAISEEVITTLRNNPSQSFFLFLNRRGSTTHIFCRDCSYVPACKQCKRTLVYYESRRQLVCNYCKMSWSVPLDCPSCGGPELRFVGIGVEKLEQEMRNVLQSDSRPIVRIDSDSTTGHELKYPSIIIGTQLAWQKIDWSRLSGAVFVEADIQFFIPEFKSLEQLWFYIRDARYRLTGTAPLYVQTRKTDHPFFQKMYRPEELYASEIVERKTFGYPPFSYIIKLFVGKSSLAEAEREADKLYKTLVKLTNSTSAITIHPPTNPVPALQKGQFWQIIIAKIGYKNYQQNYSKILSVVPDDWKVDINPNTLIGI